MHTIRHLLIVIRRVVTCFFFVLVGSDEPRIQRQMQLSSCKRNNTHLYRNDSMDIDDHNLEEYEFRIFRQL